MKKVYICSDNNGHNYIIPIKLRKLFFELLENDEDNEWESFNELFGKYMTGGGINNIQLYAEI